MHKNIHTGKPALQRIDGWMVNGFYSILIIYM